jgi:hypothetical protein
LMLRDKLLHGVSAPFGDVNKSSASYEGQERLPRLVAAPPRYADLDLARVVEAKHSFDVAGHYARPDIFELRINRKPHAQVVESGSSSRQAHSQSANAPTLLPYDEWTPERSGRTS